MLSNERNNLLSATGRGTPMDELLRDRSGNYGLVDRHCPHRRADMTYGFVEDRGLRCNYHGWLFDHTGRCLHQPFEETRHPEGSFRDKVCINAYQVKEKAGLLWAYLGFILPDAALLIHDGWTLDEATAARYADVATGIREDEDHDGPSIPHDHPERPPHPLARPRDAPVR